MGELRIMDVQAGDLKVIWDKSVPDEVQSAREQFEKLMKKKYLAFKVKKDGSKGTQITEFDPDAEMIIMSPPLKGG